MKNFLLLCLLVFLFCKAQDVEMVRNVEYLWEWKTTGYYTPVEGQERYYVSRDYDFKMNCSGDCLVTASWYTLKSEDSMKIVACPKSIKLGTILHIYWLWDVRCEDRWGSIKNKRLDIWNWIWDSWLNNILNNTFRDGKRDVYRIYYTIKTE